MSRSIHTTRADIDRARMWHWADAELREDEIDRLIDEARTKRRIKSQVRVHRASEDAELPPTDVDSIPVLVLDQGDNVQYPATPEDIRCIMRMLPRGALDGLASVELALGLEDQEDRDWGHTDVERDPYTGRFGVEVLPGMYAGPTLGVYSKGSNRIRLFAYVYAPGVAERSVWELHLRLGMLGTLVHEAAHHYDAAMRVARGRWRMDATRQAESYADQVADQWMGEYVIPYLMKTYHEDLAALAGWIREHGGVEIPFPLLAGDPAVTSSMGRFSFWSVSTAFERLALDVGDGVDPVKARLEFAKGLHYGENYALSLQIIDRVLSERPDDIEAIALKADIYCHQEDYARSLPLFESVLSVDPNNQDAWITASIVYDRLSDWSGLEQASDWLLGNWNCGEHRRCSTILDRCRARIHLGKLDDARADLAQAERIEWRGGRAPSRVVREIAELKEMLEQHSSSV